MNPEIHYVGYVFWQEKEAITVHELLRRMAEALHPKDDTEAEQIGRAGCEISLETAVKAAVRDGRLTVRNPIDMRPHTLPLGAALWTAVVLPRDAKAFVEESALAIMVRTENAGHGSGTTEWEHVERDKAERHSVGHYYMAEAAQLMADAYGLDAKDFLNNRMVPAFEAGALVLVDRRDTGPVKGRGCRVLEDWVTPERMNAWLAHDGFSYRWPVANPLACSDSPSVEHLSIREVAQLLRCSEERVLQHATLDGLTAHVLFASEVLDEEGAHRGSIKCLCPLFPNEVAGLRANGEININGVALLQRKPAISMPRGRLGDDVLRRIDTGSGSFGYERRLKTEAMRFVVADLLFALDDVRGLLAARSDIGIRPSGTFAESASAPVTLGASNEHATTAAASAPRAPGSAWSLKTPLRYQGYGKPLYEVLKAAHTAGLPRPTARDVLDAFTKEKPLVVFELQHDGFSYWDAKGNSKAVDIRAIGEAIRRMTEPSPRQDHGWHK